MSTTIFSKAYSLLKQSARKRQRAANISYMQALDETAKAAGIDHWHRVSKAYKRSQPTENAFRKGFVFAIDTSDAVNLKTGDPSIVYDHDLTEFCRADLVKVYLDGRASVEEDVLERPLREIYKPDRLKELAEYFLNDMVLFRVAPSYFTEDLDQMITHVRKLSFFPPEYYWMKGKLVVRIGDLPIDEDGNNVGIRTSRLEAFGETIAMADQIRLSKPASGIPVSARQAGALARSYSDILGNIK